MMSLKQCIISFRIGLYLFKKVSNKGYWSLPLVYIINFFNIDFRLNCILLLAAIVHKLYIDTYITDRFLSTLILFSTILTKFLDDYIIYSILLMAIIEDTIFYLRLLKERNINREINKDFESVSKHYSSISLQQPNELNLLLYDSENEYD